MHQDIEAYLDGTLDPEARALFEAQLAQDEALQTALTEARTLREDLAWIAVEQGLKQREQSFWDKKNALKKRKRWIWLALGFTLLLITGILCWPSTKQPTIEAPAQRTLPDSLPATPGNRLPVPANEPQLTNDTMQKQQKMPVSRLFAQYFKPYKDESLEPFLRGDSEPMPSDKFQQLYWDGNYREALAQFGTLPPTAKTNDNLLFLKAECLMALGRVGEAVPIYEAILKRDKSRYMEVAAWHRALANLRLGKTTQAKTQLQEMVRSGTKWRGEAAALLKSLQ